MTDEATPEETPAEPDSGEAELIENTSDPDEMPYGNAEGEVKGPDPAEHPGNEEPPPEG